MLVSAEKTVLMQTEMKMPINRPGKTKRSQLQALKNELIAENSGMGWVSENLINTDVTVCSHITPQQARLLLASVAKRKVYWLCGCHNVRVKQESF